jgi:hypothetical protein
VGTGGPSLLEEPAALALRLFQVGRDAKALAAWNYPGGWVPVDPVFWRSPLPWRCAFFLAASSRCFSSWSSLYCVESARERRFAEAGGFDVELSACTG